MTAPKPKLPRPCRTCNEIFTPHDPRQMYCSSICRNTNPDKLAYSRVRQRELKARLSDYKLQVGCARCGYKEHSAALHFNHLGDKSFNISQDAKVAWSKLFAEIEKCEVLCANCHAVHTYEERHFHTKRRDYKEAA